MKEALIMKKCKVFSIFIASVFLFNSVSYADEKIKIPSNGTSSTSFEQELSGVEISDITIKGMEKSYNEELEAYVFTSNETSFMDAEDSSENSIELVDYTIEKIETFEDQPENRPDNYFEYQENDETMLAATTTDLAAHGLAANGEIRPGQQARFTFYLTNYGSENLTNVDYEIRINGKIVGTVPISATIQANTQYQIGFIINGLSAGQYELVVNVDPNNKINETTKINNITALSFYVQDGVADLTAEITSPTTAKLPGVGDDNKSQPFTVRIENRGTGSSPTNVMVRFYADNRAITEIYLDTPLPPNSGGDIEFNLLFAVYKPTEIKVTIDPNNIVPESNENNNSHARIYEPDFCLHPWFNYLKETGDISVQVSNTAFFGNVDMSIFEDTLGAWNGITNSLEVVDAAVSSSDSLLDGYDVLIKGMTRPVAAPANTRAETTMKGVSQTPRTTIELYTNSSMATSSRSDNARTIIHELGHVFNLQHPDEFGPTCRYTSIMYQSGNPLGKNEIKLHDKYAIYMLHEIGARLLDIQPKAEEESHEYQTFFRYPDEIYSLDELESYAPYVVKGRILDEGQNMNVGGNYYTRTGFEVNKVYKGDLESGQTIYLEEPYYQEVIAGENYTRYYDGYTKSIVGDEYIFFLNKNSDTEEYGVVKAPLSRYNLSREDTIVEDVDNQSTKKVYTAENHSKIKEEVLQKYQ